MSHTIAAVATPLSAGGIGVIRISGDDAIEIADRVIKTTSGKALSSLKGYTAAHGKGDKNGGCHLLQNIRKELSSLKGGGDVIEH